MCMCAHMDASWCAAGRGGKQPGSLPGTPWLSDLWRPRCTSSSSSMQQDVCSPPADSPTKENGEWRSLHDADLTGAPLPRLQAVTPLCCWTFLPLKPNFCPPKEGKKTCRSSQTYQRRRFSLCLLSLILYCMSSIWQMLMFWKTADIESAMSDCTANTRQVCLTPNVISQFDIECRHKCYICCLLMLCMRKILQRKSTERALNVI